jgi:hypothetical protein
MTVICKVWWSVLAHLPARIDPAVGPIGYVSLYNRSEEDHLLLPVGYVF